MGHVDRKLEAMTQMLKVLIQRQEEMFDFQRESSANRNELEAAQQQLPLSSPMSSPNILLDPDPGGTASKQQQQQVSSYFGGSDQALARTEDK